MSLLWRVAELYAERRDALATTITREMGKPISQARLGVDLVVSIYTYYADKALESCSMRRSTSSVVEPL